MHNFCPIWQVKITQTFFVYFWHTIAEVLKFDMYLKDNQVSYHNKHIAFRHVDTLQRNQKLTENAQFLHDLTVQTILNVIMRKAFNLFKISQKTQTQEKSMRFQQAMVDVHDCGMSIREAAAKWQVAKTSLYNCIVLGHPVF